MTEEDFWKLIAESRSRIDPAQCRQDVNFGDDFLSQQIDHLTSLLRDLPPREIQGYAVRFSYVGRKLYRWDIWNAVYWIHGGCSDDGFSDFRASLISTGKERYERVLENPDSLAEIEDERDVPTLLSEGFQYVGPSVYEKKTGERISFSAFPDWPGSPEGERFDENDLDAVERQFPRIFAKYPKMGDS